jgi:HAE1 family hydrophobic/amphiphilic exporter-1
VDRITRFSLKNAAVVIIIALLLLGGGVYSAAQLKKETMPDINIPVVAVVTTYPGAAPNDVYENVTKPIEQAVQGVSGVQKRQSTAADSVSVVVVQFGFSADMDKAENDVKKAIEGVKLPENAEASQVKRISFGSSPILKLAVVNDSSTEVALRSSVRDTMLPALKGVAGVGEATIASDAENKVRIVFDPAKLRKHKLTAEQVTQQLQGANLSFPVGSVDVGTESQPIRVTGTLGTVDQLKEFSVAVYPDQSAVFGDAFKKIGKGFGALGSAMGALGSGMGQLGSGMGQLGAGIGTVGKMTGTVAQLQGMQGALSQLTVPLNNAQVAKAQATKRYEAAQAVLDETDPPLPSDYDKKLAQQRSDEASAAIKTANMTIAALAPQAAQLQAAIAELQGQLMASKSSGGSSSSGGSMSSGGGSMSGSSGGSSSLKVKASDAKIKLIKLSDVASVTYGPGPDTVGSRFNSKPGALIDIVKSQDANTIDVAKGVRKEMEKLAPQLPAGMKIEYVYDASDGINLSVKGMLEEGLLGALFAFIVILLFLRNWRSTIIAIISIPLSVLTCLVALNQAGITLNVMTLGGLTVAIGRVVDDSIVVIENIYRHLARGDERTPETIRVAVSEVSSAITSSTLTTVAVFLPLGLVTGVIGKIFQPFAITVALALLASLAVAVTVVPLVAKWTLLGAKVKHVEEGSGLAVWLYKRTLGWCLDNKAAVLIGALAMLIASLALVPLIGTGFVPESKEKYVTLNLEYPEGTKAAKVDGTMRAIERILAKDSQVAHYDASTGGSGGFTFSAGVQGTNQGQMFMRLKKDVKSAQAFVEKLRTEVKQFEPDGAKITIAALDASGGDNSIEVDLTGANKADLAEAAVVVTKAMRQLGGLENVTNNVTAARSQIAIDVDQKAAAKQGMVAGSVAGTVRSLVAEQDLGTMKVDGKDTSIVYALKLDPIEYVAEIEDTMLDTPMNKKNRLSSIASVQETASPVSVLTKEGAQYAAVTGSIAAKDTGKVIANAKAAIAELKLPAGVTATVGGTADDMNQSFSQLGLAMIIAIAAVYLVMVIAFGEAVAPLAIMFALPLAIIGGLFGLFIMHLPLDIPALIGALMLIGIVVTNAIVLVDRVQQKRRAGLPMREALQDAGATRMRPIFMTALATIFALVPLASGFAEGALISQSLAVIVIGGLTTSTVLTLVVVPVAYSLLEGWREKLLGGRHEPEPPGDAEPPSEQPPNEPPSSPVAPSDQQPLESTAQL